MPVVGVYARNMSEVEARAYGPDSSAEERAALRARVQLRGEDVVLYRELPVSSVFSINTCYDRITELVEGGAPYLIVDIRDTERPDAPRRKVIQARVQALEGQLRHIAVVTNTNPFLRVAARFIQSTIRTPMSFHDSYEQAEAKFRQR